MQITYDIFRYYCPSSAQPTDKLIDRLSAFIVKSRQEVRNLVGEELFDLLDSKDFDICKPDGTDEWSTLSAMAAFICLNSYAQAIPSLDLVLTPTGFGVVNNQNVVPASADRVRNLRERIEGERDDALDMLLSLLRDFEEWRNSDQAQMIFSSLFWHGEDMRNFPDMQRAHRSDLVAARPKIAVGEEALKRVISPELFEALCGDIRKKAKSVRRESFITHCRNFVARAADGLDTAQQRLSLIAYLDRYLEYFPEYEGSSAYKANYFTPYENRRHDSCYFFG